MNGNHQQHTSWHTDYLKDFPLYGWIGVAFALLSWAGNWGLKGLRTRLLFFPQWLGYILTRSWRL